MRATREYQRTYFYYPDVSVFCGFQKEAASDLFRDDPVVIIEVLSDSTRRRDEGEKRENYLSISTRREVTRTASCLLATKSSIANP